MSKNKVKEWKSVPAKCACCLKCKIFIEGPLKGSCPCGGPFLGYYDEVTGKSFTLDTK